MKDPLISIIVPVYNVERYLDECVKSILNQTYRNLEIILIDDGSSDRCPEMCEAWAKKDPRITVIHKENGGSSSARNAGLDIARGDYIAFVDSDDYIDENMYTVLLQALQNAKTKIACCSAYHVLETGHKIPPRYAVNRTLPVAAAIDAVFFEEQTSSCDKLYARSLWESVRFPEGEVNEDVAVLVPVIAKASGMAWTKEILYNYRERQGSITNSCRYINEKYSGVVYKNLNRIAKQLEENKLPYNNSYRYFAASSAYNMALIMEKKYPQLSEAVKEHYRRYRRIMTEYMMIYLVSPYSRWKDKVLYMLVLTRLLRPAYSVFYPEHL